MVKSAKILICPATLFKHAPLIFKPPCLTTESWLSQIPAIAVDPTERIRGILGYYSQEQMDRSKVSTRTSGEPVAWAATINSLWSKLSDYGGSSVHGLWERRSPHPSPVLKRLCPALICALPAILHPTPARNCVAHHIAAKSD